MHYFVLIIPFKCRFKDELADLIKEFEEKLVPPSPRVSSPDIEEPAPKKETKPRKPRKSNVPRPTLTEADLLDSSRNKKAPNSRSNSLIRSRSISVEPFDADGNGRRSRSRSVSISAEEIKAVGGKRGGIAGNSKLFASEVNMRRQSSSSSITSASTSGRGMKRVSSVSSVSSVATETGGLLLNIVDLNN